MTTATQLPPTHERIDLEKIQPNPFQIRTTSEESIAKLAAEIDASEYMETAFPARKNGKIYEIACGHRRIEALRLLGFDTVLLDVKPRSDGAMQRILLSENANREDLTVVEQEKAFILALKAAGTKKGAMDRVASMLNISAEIATGLNAIRKAKRKGVIEKDATIAPIEANLALRLGGDEMLATTVSKGIKRSALQAITKAVKAATETAGDDADLLAKVDTVRESIVAGKLTTEDDVRGKLLAANLLEQPTGAVGIGENSRKSKGKAIDAGQDDPTLSQSEAETQVSLRFVSDIGEDILAECKALTGKALDEYVPKNQAETIAARKSIQKTIAALNKLEGMLHGRTAKLAKKGK